MSFKFVAVSPLDCRLVIKQLIFVPYGDTITGSAERKQYISFLVGYLREGLMPVLDAWEGDMPEHVQKVTLLLGLLGSWSAP